MSRVGQVVAALQALVSPSPVDVAQALHEFGAKDSAAAAAYEALNAGGGSQPFRIVTLDVAFDTPGLAAPASGPAGIHVADLAANEGIAFVGPDTFMGVMVFEAWDGTNPQVCFCTSAGRGSLPGTPPTPFQKSGGIDLADTELAPGIFGSAINLDYSGMTYVTAPTAIYAYVDDGSGGDPGSTQGAGRIMLVIVDCS